MKLVPNFQNLLLEFNQQTEQQLRSFLTVVSIATRAVVIYADADR
jgi:hypothetical protein